MGNNLGNNMAKEHSLGLMGKSMKGNGRIINLGREHYTAETKTSLEEL